MALFDTPLLGDRRPHRLAGPHMLALAAVALGLVALVAMAGLRTEVVAAALFAGGAAAWAILSSARAALPTAPAAVEPAPGLGAAGVAALPLALPDPVMIVEGVEPDGAGDRRIIFANPPARALYRLGEPPSLLLTSIRDPEVLEAVDEALFGGTARTVLHLPGGVQDRAWRISARPLPPAGDAHRCLLHFRDETDSRRVERMRADFLANASHELRTPLASLGGFIETLKGPARDDPKAQDRFLDIMADQVSRMSRLVGDLMSLSRVELNEHIPPSGRVDLSLAVTDTLDAMTPIAREAEVRLSFTPLERGDAAVIGDRDEIIQVAQNLIHNAIKFTPAGGEVVIEARSGLTLAEACASAWPQASRMPLLTPDPDERVRYVRLTVRDHGPGIARENLPRLTERFYRVEGAKPGKAADPGGRAGSGLGLAIVKHIVNRHRGGLAVESVPGQGAVFAVYYPQATSA
ncbi:ATP-binding protein [Brevundimonas sp. 2R-24]|uniref:histidine kinase n=1 Tax=Peiella sedimenti TaxID=3061083 RepID=A0ABT8SM44_9CAUL|nr:ATP-binding protein [Caulobacteraceae bacterium XZ-24]